MLEDLPWISQPEGNPRQVVLEHTPQQNPHSFIPKFLIPPSDVQEAVRASDSLVDMQAT